MDLVTLHTHSSYCPHSDTPIADMFAAAHNAGMKVVAATEHYPLTEAIEPTHYVSMNACDLPAYLADIARACAKYPDMRILAGCELDWLGSLEDRNLSEEDFAPFDIVLGSIHSVDGWFIDDKQTRSHWDELDIPAFWQRYFEVFCEAASSAPDVGFF